MKQLVLATHNKDKVKEFLVAIGSLDVEVLTLDQFPTIGEIEEDAPTLEGNALKKAREVFRQTHLPSIADDTGLEVFALYGEPGVYSSRYAGPGATYADNCRKLLRNLRGYPPRRRGAQFRTVLAFVAQGVEITVDGVCPGTILEDPRGAGGFGYDPVFLPLGEKLTFAEMDLQAKNVISHRGRALKSIREPLVRYFTEIPP